MSPLAAFWVIVVACLTGGIGMGLIYLLRRKTILRWRTGGIPGEMKLAHCGTLVDGKQCGRQIIGCAHDLGLHEGAWEHYDDSTAMHYDKDGMPVSLVTHR